MQIDDNPRPEVDRVLSEARAEPDATLRQLAERAHLSEFHLSRLLKKHLGFPLRDFMAALKVERGVGALIEGRDVTRSQAEAGHDSPSSYHRSFVRHTGLAPSRFRKQMRQLAAQLISRMDADAPLALIHRTFDAEAHPQPHPLTLRVVGAAPGAALFLALHPTPIVHREPLLGIALLGSDECQVTAIPDGAYYSMMLEVPRSADLRTYFDMDNNRRQLRREPIVFPLTEPLTVTLEPRDLIPSDPPITMNLPKLFLQGRLDLSLIRGEQVSNPGQDDGNSRQAQAPSAP